MKTLSFRISDEAFELLIKINVNRYAEYRDTQYGTLEDFRKSDEGTSEFRTEESFLARNFGGTYHLIGELLRHNLVDCDNDSWHTTYELTEVGKEILRNNS